MADDRRLIRHCDRFDFGGDTVKEVIARLNGLVDTCALPVDAVVDTDRDWGHGGEELDFSWQCLETDGERRSRLAYDQQHEERERATLARLKTKYEEGT